MAEDIDRTDADALFTEGMRLEIINQLTTKESVALQTIPTVQMSNKKDKVPVVSTLPTAGFLAAEGTAKPEDEVTWEGKYLQAEEIAVIIPIDDTVIADAQIDVASQVTKLVAQEFARVIDAAVFFGTGAPSSWPVGGVFGAVDATNKIPYTGIEDYGKLFSAVEVNGNDVTDLWASREVRADLRHPIIDGQAMQAPGLTIDNVYGVPLTFPLGWDKTKAKAIAADDECLSTLR